MLDSSERRQLRGHPEGLGAKILLYLRLIRSVVEPVNKLAGEMLEMNKKPSHSTWWAHAIAIALLIALFGGTLFSLSVDIAHHYAIIDAIMKNGTANLPYIGYMSRYPALSYWLAAGVGHLIGSGLVAMWLISIAAVYASYYFLLRMICMDRNIFPLVLFLIFAPVLALSEAFFGFEVIVNFFYPQLIGAAIYCGFLFCISKQEHIATLKNVTSVLLVAGLTLSVHGLPAIEILGTFGILLALSIVTGFLLGTIDRLNIASFVLFAVCAGALLKFHPDFAALRQFSQNNGGINLAIRSIYLLPMAGGAAGLLSFELLFFRGEKQTLKTNAVLLSAIAAATLLMVLQWAWFVLFNDGSIYAIRKHSYFVFTASAIAYLYVASYRLQPLVDRYIKSQAVSLGPAIIVSAAIMASVVFLERPAWEGPGFNLFKIVHQIRYAETALATSHPHFEPGNTVVVANSIHPNIRYLISTTTFQMEVSVMPAISILTETFDPKKSSEYVMIESSSEANKSCPLKYVETKEFSIIPVSCLK